MVAQLAEKCLHSSKAILMSVEFLFASAGTVLNSPRVLQMIWALLRNNVKVIEKESKGI